MIPLLEATPVPQTGQEHHGVQEEMATEAVVGVATADGAEDGDVADGPAEVAVEARPMRPLKPRWKLPSQELRGPPKCRNYQTSRHRPRLHPQLKMATLRFVSYVQTLSVTTPSHLAITSPAIYAP